MAWGSKSKQAINQGRDRNVSLDRKLRFLESILPIFHNAAQEAWKGSPPYTPERRFWTKFNTYCLLIGSDGWNFSHLDETHGQLVGQLLIGLESSILKVDKFAEGSDAVDYPRLEILRDQMEPFATTEMLLVGKIRHLEDRNASRELLTTLERLSNILKDETPQLPEEETAVSSRSKPLLSPVLLNLLSTMASYLRQCNCPKPHQAILPLLTHCKAPAKDGSHCFTLLLSRRAPDPQWQEAAIVVNEKLLPGSSITFSLPGDDEPSAISSSVVRDLCSMINQSNGYQLELKLDGKNLFHITNSRVRKEETEDMQLISLMKGLFWTDQQAINLKTKTCLALVMSYALLDFCGEPWFPEGWTKNGLHFLQRGKRLLLRPILVTNLGPHIHSSSQPKVPADLKLLYHAVLLMEIFMQAPTDLKLHPTEKLEVLRDLVQREYDTIEWGESENFQRSVKSCIDGTMCQKLEQPPKDTEAHFVSFYYRTVLDRLNTDFRTLWPEKNSDPDEVLAGLTIKRAPQKGSRPPIPHQKPMNLKGYPLCATTPRPTKLQRLFPMKTKEYPIKFFDSSDEPDPKQVIGAADWFGRADKNELDLPKRPPISQRRVKIAILDTGINLDNAWISSRSQRIKCWPSEKECKDTDGHGSHVAYILLRLTKHVDLRIAKINDSQSFTTTKMKVLAERIAKAIKHFSDEHILNKEGQEIPNPDRVDIINLSFGFQKHHPDLDPILKAIRTARANGVITFAAAGNGGGNDAPSWPAILDGDVIRIHSTTALGQASSFNPNLPNNKSICTLGEAVPSCEKNTATKKIIHRNGTSFATPIAVCMASLALGILDDLERKVDLERRTKPESEWTPVPDTFPHLMKALRTKTGMELVLSKAFVQTAEDGARNYSYAAPWFFFETPEVYRASRILTLLQDVQE